METAVPIGETLQTVLEVLISKLDGPVWQESPDTLGLAREWSRRYWGERDTFDCWLFCVYCGEAAEVLDHIIPKCHGGTDAPQNLAPACWSCNSSKGGRTPEQWFAPVR